MFVQPHPFLKKTLPETDPFFGNVSLLLEGDEFVDRSSLANTVTVGTGVTLGEGAVVGSKAYLFNASSTSHMTVPHINGLVMDSDDYTIEAWINLAQHPENNSSNSSVVFTKSGKYNASYPNWMVSIHNNQLRLGIGNSGSPGTFIHGVYGGDVIQLNRWHHIAVTKQGSTAYLFLDGKLTSTTTLAGTPSDPITQILCIGWEPDNPLARFNGRMCGIRITRGVCRYTGSFEAVPRPIAKNWSDHEVNSTELLMHMEGVPGTSTFHDSSIRTKSISVIGSPTVSHTNSKFGTSLYFDGSSTTARYLLAGETSEFNLGSGNFTIEYWLRTPASLVSGNHIGLLGKHTATVADGWANYILSDTAQPSVHGRITFDMHVGGIWRSGGGSVPMSPVLPLGQWVHVAIVRLGDTFTIYANGVAGTSVSYSGAIQNVSQRLSIGSVGGNAAEFTGHGTPIWMDEIRITSGVARYRANFTPPNTPFPDPSLDPFENYVTAQLNFDSYMEDVSRFRRRVTTIGQVRLVPFGRYGFSSGYFPGGGDSQLKLAHGSELNITGDFTIECWVNFEREPTAGVTETLVSKKTSIVNFGWVTINRKGTNDASLGKLEGICENSSAVIMSATSSTTLVANTWYHVAFSVRSGYCYIYINGVLEGQGGNGTGTIHNNTAPLLLGAAGEDRGQAFKGWMDDFRFTNGITRYHAMSFLPPVRGVADRVPVPIDPLWGRVALHIKADGSNNSTAIIDESQYNHSFSLEGTTKISTDVGGIGGSALYSTGGRVILNHHNIFNIGLQEFTFETWVYIPSGVTFTNDVVPLFCIGRHSTASNHGGYNLHINENGASAIIESCRTDGTNLQQRASGLNIPRDKWTHISFNRSRFESRGIITVNGKVFYTTGAINAEPYLNHNSLPIAIAGTFNGTGSNQWGPNHYMDEVRITIGACRYTKEFSPIFDKHPTGSLVEHAWYDFEEVSNNRVLDKSPFGHDLTITSPNNAILITTGGAPGNRLHRAGNSTTSDIIYAPVRDAWFQRDWNRSFTWFGWFWIDNTDINSDSWTKMILGQWAWDNTNGWVISVYNGTITFYLKKDGTSFSSAIGAPGTVGEKRFLYGVYNAATRTAYGGRDATTYTAITKSTNSGVIPAGSLTGTRLNNFSFGYPARNNVPDPNVTNASSRVFTGKFDGVGLVDRVLTDAELVWLMNNGTGRNYAEAASRGIFSPR